MDFHGILRATEASMGKNHVSLVAPVLAISEDGYKKNKILILKGRKRLKLFNTTYALKEKVILLTLHLQGTLERLYASNLEIDH